MPCQGLPFIYRASTCQARESKDAILVPESQTQCSLRTTNAFFKVAATPEVLVRIIKLYGFAHTTTRIREASSFIGGQSSLIQKNAPQVY